MTKERNRGSKVKLVVSLNGEFRRHSPSRKLKYAGGDNKVISVDPLITFSELKSKIKNLVSNDDVCNGQLTLSYTYSFFDGVGKMKGIKGGCIGSDHDVGRMIRDFELVQGLGKSCRIWVFACNGRSDVCLDRCCDVKNWVFRDRGFRANCGDLRENSMTQLSRSEKDWKFIDDSLTRFCEKELQILEKELDDIDYLNDGLGENGVDLVSGNECSDGRIISFCSSHDDGSLSFEEKTLDFGKVLNTDVVGNKIFREDSSLLNSGKQNPEEGNSCVDENWKFVKVSSVPVNGSWGQGSLSLDSENGTISGSSEAMKVLQLTISNGMDEENSKSGRTSLAPSDSSLACNTNKKENKSREGIQSSHQSNLRINRKDQDEDVSARSKDYDRISAEVAACYNHLESIELQTIKYSDLEIVKKLGEGAYGIVYYGKCKGSDVAIKRAKLNCTTEGTPEEDKLVKDFWKEAQILGKLHHPNIVALFGVVTDGPNKYLATVTEYMVNGSLKQVLQKRDRTIDRRKRVIIAREAASGMEYLHENNIVHFDLKSHNLLVNMRDPLRPVCKIGDLGLSKIKQRSLVSGGLRGTLPWMAPELFDAKSMVTEKVDVYSFGIVMWELLTGETPYANMRSNEILAGMIEGDLRPEIPTWCDPAWRSLMERCWSSDPVTRPSFIKIVKELKAMGKSMNIK